MKNRSIALALLMVGVLAADGMAQSLLDRLHADRASYGRYSGDGNWHLAERIWLPAAPDPTTIALYPMNPVDEKKEVDSLLTDALETTGDDVAGDLRDAVAGTGARSGLELRDAAAFAVKRPAYGIGDCVLVTNGVHGGALRLGGGKSVVELPDTSLRAEFTVEAWFKPETLGGTLMHLTVGGYGDAFAMRLDPEGRMIVTWRGKSVGVSERRMTPGTFSHVAFAFRRRCEFNSDRWYAQDCLVFMDGYPQVWLGRNYAQQIAGLGQPLLIGNTAGRDDPFVGLVDDVRVSATARDFYQHDNAESDPLAARAIPKGLPIMRGEEELILDAPLDGVPDVEGLFRASAVPAAASYLPARRGRGMVIDASRRVRFDATNAIAAAQGAIEFWFMPHDWDNNKPYYTDKVNLNYTAPVFQLFMGASNQPQPKAFLSMAIDETSETKGFLIPYYLHPVQPGTWRHAIVTWQGHDVRLFIDGEEYPDLLGSHPVYLLRPDRTVQPDKLQITALVFGGFRSANALGATVIDEVKLYKHRLTAPEIANAYQRFLTSGKVQPLPPIDLQVAVNHPLRSMSAAVDLLMPERYRTAAFDLEVVKTSELNAVIDARTDVRLEDGNCFLKFANPKLTYGEYLFKFAFKDGEGKPVKSVEVPHSYPQPAWVDNTLGVHDGEVMSPWTPMEYKDGIMTCWGREMTIGPSGWPVKIVSQGRVIMPAGPEIRLVTDQGEVTLAPEGGQPKVVKQQPGAIETEGVAKGGGWTMTTSIRTEFDGFMKLQTRFEGPANAEVRELRISYPLQFADEQLFGFYTGEHWFRAAHDFRILPRPTTNEIVFASNKTGRGHPRDWAGKVSFLPYVTVGDDWRQFVWLAENDRHWTQSWTKPAITISRAGGLTRLNLNIIQAPKTVTNRLEYVFGLQATPIKPLDPDFRTVQSRFNFGHVCGFNGFYMQAPHEGHMSFRLSPKNLDWTHPEQTAKTYRSSKRGQPLMIYFDRTWQRAPEDAREYNRDWRGWGDATRYTKPVRDCYAWYINEYLRRGLMDGMYIDDAWIDPTKALSHLDPADNLAYRKEGGKPEDFSDREWGYEFFDYREMLQRIRWLYLDNGVKPLIVTHVTQTPYYPIFAYVDIMLEGEDRYLSSEREARDFITSWGLPRLRYASPEKWGIPVAWLPILSPKHLKPTGMPMVRWYYQQRRAHQAGLLMHDISGSDGPTVREAQAAGCYSDAAKFIGYWDPQAPVTTTESNVYVSAYQLPTHLTLVLVNAGTKERVVDVTLDVAKVKALLGTDSYVIRDVDTGVIPPIDKEYEQLLTGGIKMKAFEEGVPSTGELDNELSAMADNVLWEMEAAEKKANDPDGDIEYHNFRHENGKLRLRIQRNDYRLLKVSAQ